MQCCYPRLVLLHFFVLCNSSSTYHHIIISLYLCLGSAPPPPNANKFSEVSCDYIMFVCIVYVFISQPNIMKHALAVSSRASKQSRHIFNVVVMMYIKYFMVIWLQLKFNTFRLYACFIYTYILVPWLSSVHIDGLYSYDDKWTLFFDIYECETKFNA